MIIYGSMQCPDCVQCCEELDSRKVTYEFRDISENLLYLKEFLKLRDTEELFVQVKADDKIGIPCLLQADGSISLNW